MRRLFAFGLYLVLLLVLFHRPLWDWVRFVSGSDLYSHVLLLPGVTAYLVWLQRKSGSTPLRTFSWWVLLPFVIGLATMLAYNILTREGWHPSRNDSLSVTIFSFVCFLVGGVGLLFGSHTLRQVGFPVLLLFFMAPFPDLLVNWIEIFLQHASAEVAHAFLALSGASCFRQGLTFHLPNISIAVAEECSGIHSSLALFLTSLLAGYLFLRRPWTRTLLALAVLPLGILRNGVRIAAIALLCVHGGPDMIDSPLHRRGGPVFFLLSLVPFFLCLLFLRWAERGKNKPAASLPNAALLVGPSARLE